MAVKFLTIITKRAVKKRFCQYMVCMSNRVNSNVFFPLERNDVTKLIYNIYICKLRVKIDHNDDVAAE